MKNDTLSRLDELNLLSVWLKTTQMCEEDKLLLSYHIINRVKELTKCE